MKDSMFGSYLECMRIKVKCHMYGLILNSSEKSLLFTVPICEGPICLVTGAKVAAWCASSQFGVK